MRKRAVFRLAAAGLAALIIATPADAQANKNTAGKGIALKICRMETFADAFEIFLVRRSGTKKASMERPSKLMQGRNVCRFQNIREE